MWMLPPIPFSEQVNPPEQTNQGNKTYLFQQLKPTPHPVILQPSAYSKWPREEAL